MSERSPSGLWRLFAPAVSTSSSSSPRPSAPSSSGSGRHPAVPASSGSGLHRATAPRGLPAEPKAKAQMLLELAAAACEQGQWAGAESHLRLALTFDPGDGVVQRRLKEVVEARDLQRRSASALRR